MRVPLFVQKIFKSATWCMPPRPDPVLFLTFDDGPHPDVTPHVLDILKNFRAKATFFCVGENILQHRDVFEKTLAAGHAIGNHSFYHLNGWKTKTSDYFRDVNRCDEILTPEIGKWEMGNGKQEMGIGDSKINSDTSGKKINSDVRQPNLLNATYQLPTANYSLHTPNSQLPAARLFRPPYGKLTLRQYATLRTEYKIVMWDVLSGDFNKNRSGEECSEYVCQNARNGSIVVFHDSVKAKERVLYSLPKVLEYFSKKNFSFNALTSDLL